MTCAIYTILREWSSTQMDSKVPGVVDAVGRCWADFGGW